MTIPSPVRVVRPRDLLVLDFEFHNLRLQAGSRGPELVQDLPTRPALVMVLFPSQALVERAYFQAATSPANLSSPLRVKDPDPNHVDPDKTNPGDTVDLPPIRARIGGRSRLSFVVPEGHAVPFTVEGLLTAMRILALHVVDAAKLRRAFQPGQLVTADAGWANVLFEGPGLGRRRRRSDVARRYQLLHSSATLAARFGLGTAVTAASATDASLLIGRVREELVDGDSDGEEFVAQPIPENPWLGSEGRTAVELPFRLLLSPHDGAAWAHRVHPVEHAGRTELWHTRLGRRVAGAGSPGVDELTPGNTVRAVWTREFGLVKPFDAQSQSLPAFDGSQDKPPKSVLRMSLTASDRISIVHQTSNFTLNNGSYAPSPVTTDNLMLSALGGWLDSQVSWPVQPSPFSLEEWRHDATMGRDHYVRVVYAGYLYPFGHRASLVKVTERKFDPSKAGNPAYLFQRVFVVVRQPLRTYAKNTPLLLTDPASPRHNQRLELLFPFTSVRLTTLVTPDLAEPVHLTDDPSTPNTGIDAELKQFPLFFPVVDGQPFMFKAVAVDLDANIVEFRTPLLFLGQEVNKPAADGSPKRLRAVRMLYDGDVQGRHTARLVGQSVSMAPSGARSDDTRLDVSELVWGGDPPAALTGNYTQKSRFIPVVQRAQAIIPAVSRMSGNSNPSTVKYPAQYGTSGFGAGNVGELFLEVVGGAAMEFTGQRDKSGGLAAPTFGVSGLSRKAGPMGGALSTIAQGIFKPSEFFDAINATLFGVIPLSELVIAVGLDQPIKVPSFVTETLNAVTAFIAELERVQRMLSALVAKGGELAAKAQEVINRAKALYDLVVDITTPGGVAVSIDDVETLALELPTHLDALSAQLPSDVDPAIAALLARVRKVVGKVEEVQSLITSIQEFIEGFKLPETLSARIEWVPDIDSWGFSGAGVPQGDALFWPHPGKGRFALVADLKGSTSGNVTASADVSCSLEEFDLRLIAPAGFMELDFTRIRFVAQAGKKPDIEVVFKEIRFVGVLSFVESLRNVIPLDGFSDPPALDITPTGITAAYSLGLPNLAVGIFSLENLALAASLRVPFVGEPLQVGFSFCTRESPFRLTVSLFGGGGFFGVTIQPDGVKILEASFEFGAAVSLDFGVASGSLSVMAGIYFRMEGTDAALTGYFRARGEADILAIISLTIELYLSLTYEFASGKAVGRASIIVEIEILMFEESVEITCEKKFGGANSDPTLEELMGPYLDPSGAEVRPWDEYCMAFAEVG